MAPIRNVYAGFVAAVAWFALILQLYLSVRLAQANGGGAAHGVWMFVGYFTVLTNLLVAVTLTVSLLAADTQAGRFFAAPATVAGVATNIVMVGIVYSLLLRHTWNPQGAQRAADVLLHDAVPVMFLVHAWLLQAEAGATLFGRLCWAAWPIAYFLYAMIRGVLSGFYAYPFINLTELGYGRVALNSLWLAVAFAGLAVILFGLQRVRSALMSP